MRRRAAAAASVPPDASPQNWRAVQIGSDTGPVVRFMRLPTSSVLKLESDDGRQLHGAFVRYAPKLRRSEREAFSVHATEQALLARGARVAVASPVVLPEILQTADGEPIGIDPREAVRSWFAGDKGLDAEQALHACLRILDEVGF